MGQAQIWYAHGDLRWRVLVTLTLSDPHLALTSHVRNANLQDLQLEQENLLVQPCQVSGSRADCPSCVAGTPSGGKRKAARRRGSLWR